MRIPKEFKLKGKKWKVKLSPDLVTKEDCVGECDFDTRTITLDSSLKGRKKKSVFLHELFHVLVHEAHINPGVRFSEGVEEVLCDSFADLLVSSFTDLKWKKTK
jgi:hypothetical protein